MKNLKLTNFEEFKKNYLDENDKIKFLNILNGLYQYSRLIKVIQEIQTKVLYNNCFGLISQEDMQDCQQAEFLEKARTYSAFLSMSCLMLTLDRTLFRRSSFKPTKFLFQYGVLPMMSFQITKNYFCRDVEQTFHDMTEKYQFGVEQYHQGMELMTRAHKANRLGEFLEKGVDFDWSTVENE